MEVRRCRVSAWSVIPKAGFGNIHYHWRRA